MIKFASIELIRRSQIKKADYNPRIMTDERRKKLETSLRELGLVTTLVWNKRTGHLVSGHQRLDILDVEFGWPANDYELQVSVVDETLEKEKAMNLTLNSEEVSGEWDQGKKRSILDELRNEVPFDLDALIVGAQKKTA